MMTPIITSWCSGKLDRELTNFELMEPRVHHAILWKLAQVSGQVGGSNHLEKYESQWEGLSHILWKKKCLQPPTSITLKVRHIYKP